MGSNDVPPPHIPQHVVPVCNMLLQVGGTLWTVTYVLYVRESLRSRSYGMPIFALALNFSWELVYSTYVAEAPLERLVFAIWVVIDLGLLHGLVKFGSREWKHSPWVGNSMQSVFVVLLVVAGLGHWCFAKWWLDNDIGKREGKFYQGVIGPDTTELGYWSSMFCQAYLGAASLCQLLIRGHSGGVSWSIWVTRTLGSMIGLHMNFAWAWCFWREAHGYFMSPFSMFLFGVSVTSDLVYPFVLWQVQKTETTLPDGSKVARQDQRNVKAKGS